MVVGIIYRQSLSRGSLVQAVISGEEREAQFTSPYQPPIDDQCRSQMHSIVGAQSAIPVTDEFL